MDPDTFFSTFMRCFDYPDTSQFTSEQINVVENKLAPRQWSSKQVLDDVAALYQDLPEQRRTCLKDARQSLISLRETERDQRKQIRQALNDELDSSLDPVSFTVNEFINISLAQINQDERNNVKEQIQDSLENLEPDIDADSFDADTFRRPYHENDEDKLEDEFLRLYEYLLQKGWNRRDLEGLVRPISVLYDDFDDVFDRIAGLADRDRTERTYVFFVSNLQVLEEVRRDNYVYAIVPPGNLEVDELIDIYPYDDINELDIRDHSDFPDEQPIDELLEERTLIAFPIQAFGTYGGRNRALERLSEILDLFSYTHTLSQVREPHFREKAKYLVWRNDGESSCMPASVSEHGQQATIFEWDIDRIFEKLVPASQHESPLSVKLKRGMHFYRKGNNSRRDIDTIIYYIACLETIVGVGHVYRDEAIEKGLLLGKVRKSNIEMFREALQRIYEFRNEALHAGLRQVDTRGEIDVMRGVLKTALREMAEAINEEGVASMPEFISYFRAKKQATYEEWLEMLKSDGFEVNSSYPFTGTMYNSDGDVKGDVSGEIEFVEDGQFITGTVTIEDLEKEEDFEFGEGLEIEASVDGETMRISRIRENSLIVMMINQGSVVNTDPWETEFKEYTIK